MSVERLRKNRSANVNVVLWNKCMGTGKANGLGVPEVLEEALTMWLKAFLKKEAKSISRTEDTQTLMAEMDDSLVAETAAIF